MADELKSYEAFAKLNIMTEAKDDGVIPQIMFNLCDSTGGWDGDRLLMTYNSGVDASTFRIVEIKGKERRATNFELLGAGNDYKESNSNNSFIFSQYNTLGKNVWDNNFINARNNNVFAENSNTMNFINSDYNTFVSGKSFDQSNDVTCVNISHYNSKYNYFSPEFLYVKGARYKENNEFVASFQTTAIYDENGFIKDYAVPRQYKDENVYKLEVSGNVSGGTWFNASLLNSNNNKFIGYSYGNQHTTLINSNNGVYSANFDSKNIISIGNDWGHIKSSAGTIAIGQGLVNPTGTTSERIILGQFNHPNMDPNDVLVVGDGILYDDKLNELKNKYPNWETDTSDSWHIVRALDTTATTSNLVKRHNIFTVNKNGYITISDCVNPSLSARYGYDGISAYDGTNTTAIKYDELYSVINAVDWYKDIDAKLQEINEVKEDTITANAFKIVSLTSSEAYLNPTPQERTPAMDLDIMSMNLKHNTIINLVFSATNPNTTATVKWHTTLNGNPIPSAFTCATVTAYQSMQFLFMNSGSTYGFSLIR